MGWNAREEGIIKDQSISKIPEESLENQSRNFRNNLNALEVNHRKEIIELKAKFFDILEKMKS